MFVTANTSTILLVMLLQAVFGCHWHHDHAIEAPSGAEQVTREYGDHGPQPAHDEHSHHPDAPRDVAEARCLFLSAGPTDLPAAISVWTGLTADGQSASASELYHEASDHLWRPGPLLCHAVPHHAQSLICVWIV